MSAMSDPFARLLDVLTLEQIEDDIFRGTSPDTSVQRVFGGQVLGQALMAAGRSVPTERHVHSLHAYFVRPGDASVPIAYVVERVREGGSFSTRRVVARQHGWPIFQMSASFQVTEPGFEHQDPAPDVPGPEDVPTLADRAAQGDTAWSSDPLEWAAIEVRPLDQTTLPGLRPHVQPRLQVWLRVAGRLADDPLLHAAVLAYASDLTLLAVASAPHRIRFGDAGVMVASIDHAMWFHRPFRADEWLLHDEISPSASNARGTGSGRIFDLAGRLVATTVQEGLMRPVDPARRSGS
jgi:acyl-CoA thioesterase-2